MPLQSMTGFGSGRASSAGCEIEIELSSVNRRQFDVHLNIPRNLIAFEAQMYGLIHKSVTRGFVKGIVRMSCSGVAKSASIEIDKQTARVYVERIRKLAALLDLPDDLAATDLLTLPDVISTHDAAETSDKLWKLLERALKRALRQLVSMRKREGEKLHEDIDKRLGRLSGTLDRVRERAVRVPERYAKVLRKRLERLDIDLSEDDPDLAKQLALFADRADVSEELVRLSSHFTQAQKLMNSNGPSGRALDFLCQEMFREINTVGSKANDATMSRHVIRFKTILETIREQVQNVE